MSEGSGPGDRGPLGFDGDDEEGNNRPRTPAPAVDPGTESAGVGQSDWSHRRDPDLEAGWKPEPRRPPPGTRRYTWVVGIAFLVAIIYVSINTLRTNGPGSRGLSAGQGAPPFAVPLATGSLNGDANVATRSNQGSAGRVPACVLRGPQILNICQLDEHAPVVLAFLFTRGASKCEDQLDVMQRLAPRFPRVDFAAVGIAGGRGALRSLVRARGWTFPVGYDRDGILANLYAVAGCPTINLIAAGGINTRTLIGVQSQAQLEAAIAASLQARR
ncbi:MAG: TlpA family protein disulfide reductase [Solirubrobacteraceae bacterium]|nr:MAG: hypothetical protein DLM63_05750 [Solirubrobacterales bacterium]